MRKPLFPLALIGLLVGAASASAPVHVALKPNAAVSADADGFFTLGSVAVLTGGDAAERDKFRKVRVGRAPLPDQTRQITTGDVLLKLRQAGFHPEGDAVLEGPQKITITVTGGERGPTSTTPVTGSAPAAPNAQRPPLSSTALTVPTEAPNTILIHRNDPVTIWVQDGDMTISAKGTARDNGGAGDTIRAHRDGVMTDLSVTVVDAQTVQLEM